MKLRGDSCRENDDGIGPNAKLMSRRMHACATHGFLGVWKLRRSEKGILILDDNNILRHGCAVHPCPCHSLST